MTKYCQNFCEKSINSFYNCQPRPTSASALGSIKKTLSDSRKSFGNFAFLNDKSYKMKRKS